MLSATFLIAASHPCLAGHFPNSPVTPGVVTLDHVAQGILGQIPGSMLQGFPQVKFLRPLLPEIEVTVSYILKQKMLYQFKCESNDEILVSGLIQISVQEA